MEALSCVELLDLWDRGMDQAPVERALCMLAAACRDVPPDALAGFDIGRRDALLLALRERTFGSKLSSVANCAHCGERLELSFDIDDLRAAPTPPATADVLALDGYEARFRPPDSRDLAAIGEQADEAAQRLALIARCVVEVRRDGELVSVDHLPASMIDAIEEGIGRAAPQADFQIDIACPCCGHRWKCVFDIVSYFWREIDAWAVRILREVHVLASAYGWRERDILALSPARRQCYLDMVSV